MQRKINNKGMSLLELIISMAISAIVIVMVISFITAAFRIFRRTNDEVNLQIEAQTAVNQIVNMAMEAKSITERTELSSVEDRYKIDNLDLAGFSDWVIIYRSDTYKLYLVKLASGDLYETIPYSDKEHLLAEYVEEFLIRSDGSNTGMKRIDLKLVLGSDEFNVTKKVKLRNASE